MKKKEDDLARLDGVYIPKWLRALIFIISFAIAFVLFAFVLPRIMN